MEDPVRFDVWAKTSADQMVLALSVLLSSGLYPTKLEARKALNRSIRSNESMQIASSLALSEASRLINESAVFFTDATLFQKGVAPSDSGSAYCPKHMLHYGGMFGCHICSGFYAK